MDRKRWVVLGVVLLAVVAVVRVVLSYHDTAQAFDEPAEAAASIEYLDRHTYTLDPIHPPLCRIAIGLPLLLAGERFPQWPASDPRIRSYNDVGNSILYDDGHYRRNLWLARAPILAFFLLAVGLVLLWTRREVGDLAALGAVFLLATLPNVLAFSGLAYTDLPAACMQFAAIFAFANWLDNSCRKNTALLGVAVGLAVLTKFTSLLFLPAAGLAMVACKWLLERGQKEPSPGAQTKYVAKLAVAALIAGLVIWGGYGFSIGRVQEGMQLSPESMPSFEHFPAPVRSLARYAVLSNVLVPAPALLKGLASAWALNKSAPPAYLLGNVKPGGWWYFFLVAAGVKSTLPFLILVLLGFVWCARPARRRQWRPILPAVAALAILAVTTRVNCYYGVRHVLVVFPLLAIVAGCGAAWLWQVAGRSRILTRTLLAGLLLWQCVSSLRAHSDYIAYFNELAGRDPDRILVAGCDLDCGQDVFRLAHWLRQRNISHLSLAIWSSADLSRMGLPEFEVLQPFRPVTGWVAVSLRSARLGDVLHKTYPPGALAWLDAYQPVERVGKTIRIYYIAENAGSTPPEASARASRR